VGEISDGERRAGQHREFCDWEQVRK
jgi:hypothetical protein